MFNRRLGIRGALNEIALRQHARLIDATVSDQDKSKLGRLGRLAQQAGFEWVWYENELQIHASVKRRNAKMKI